MSDVTNIKEAFQEYKDARPTGESKDLYIRTLEALVEALAKHIIESQEKRARQ